MAKIAIDVITRQGPTVLLEQLADRLGFVRTSVRLYAALISRIADQEPVECGPTYGELLSIQLDELRRLELLCEAIAGLGVDPLEVVPADNLEALAVLEIVMDPQVSLPQALQAILNIEITNNNSWRMLISLAQATGHRELAVRIYETLRDEDRHLARMRSWSIQEPRLPAPRLDLEPLAAS